MDDQNREYEDYEALHDELFALLDQHRMKALSQNAPSGCGVIRYPVFWLDGRVFPKPPKSCSVE